MAIRRAQTGPRTEHILAFDDADGRVVDFDLRGTEEQIAARLAEPPPGTSRGAASAQKSRGRPKLGVVSREVTLLPRHWDWLAGQRGGASATLRRLVDEARKAQATEKGDETRQKTAQEAAYNFLHAIAGDFAGYDDAMRALFAGDRPGFERAINGWPKAIGDYAIRLAFGSDARPANPQMG